MHSAEIWKRNWIIAAKVPAKVASVSAQLDELEAQVAELSAALARLAGGEQDSVQSVDLARSALQLNHHQLVSLDAQVCQMGRFNDSLF